MTLDELMAYQEQGDLLRVLTAGSVDDGKSTLIGRLLFDSKLIYEDHLRKLERDSARVGSAGSEVDYALLTDGLRAEREQGITIDVAYRYFSTPKRKFIIADCPGHEQYTRNMATGASNCDLAIILVDARHGVIEQTRRHSFITSLLGIDHVIVTINKMDLVDYSRDVFERIRRDYLDFADRLQISDIQFIPISALRGDNVVDPGPNMHWYRGAPLIDQLETIHVGTGRNMIDLRFPVQYVLRQDQSFRGYCGSIASGVLRRGDEVRVVPSGARSRVASIVTYEGELDEAFAPMAITVALEDDIDVSRGDMLVRPNNLPVVADQLEANIVWMNERPLALSTSYELKLGTRSTRAKVTRVRYRFDMAKSKRVDAQELVLNDIGRVHLQLSQLLAFDPYQRNRATGAFVLIDVMTNETVAAGMIIDRRVSDIGESARRDGLRVTRERRAIRFGHLPATIWLTGSLDELTAIAYELEHALFERGCAVHVIDSEKLSGGKGVAQFAARAALLSNDAGLITIVAVPSSATDREDAEAMIGREHFFDVQLEGNVSSESIAEIVKQLLEHQILRQ